MFSEASEGEVNSTPPTPASAFRDDGIEMNEVISQPYQDDPSGQSGSYQDDPSAPSSNLGGDVPPTRKSNKWWCAVFGLVGVALTLFLVVAKMSPRMSEQSISGPSSPGGYPYPFPNKVLPPGQNDWTAPGGFRYAEYASGESPYTITKQIKRQSNHLARQRRHYVKVAFGHAWKGYTKFAWGMDELKPVSGKGDNVWQGLATTMVDALDTLWLMNMTQPFNHARDYIRDKLDYSTKNVSVIVFETNIRSLAGLLSAYHWSQDKVFLHRAFDIGRRLHRAFNSPTGIPFGRVNLMTGESYNEDHEDDVPTSQVGSLQLEYRWLNVLHPNPKTTEMRKQVQNIITTLAQLHPPDGLFPTMVHNTKAPAEFSNHHISFGANGDSFYEYLLKVWIQGGKDMDGHGETRFRRLYDRAIDGLHQKLVRTSEPSGLTYLIDLVDGKEVHKMHHLTCFMGGLLALGAYTDPTGFDSDRAQRDLKTGKALTYTCYQMYARQNTGLSPEEVQFIPGKDFQLEGQADIRPEGDQSEYGTQPGNYTKSNQNIMRPEVVESLYVLHAVTGDPIYRDWGWEIFQAIETYLKTPIAYGEFPDVSNIHAKPNDKMESFFLAETLKYLFLLFDPDSPVDILNTHVFNTEGHPIPVFAKLNSTN